jgi:dTDP-4-dehydrorhamnose 3,5-epimerase
MFNLKNIQNPIKIKQKKYFDRRGYFQEIFKNNIYKLNLKFTAIAKSKKNVIRGLHFQLKNKQAKFLYIVNGKILDVVVNLNSKSKDFGKVRRYILNEGDILFVPDFYAHGYECLSSKCTVLYHLEKYRDPKNESGIMYNDKSLKIKWSTKKAILSKRDLNHISFLDFKKIYKTL